MVERIIKGRLTNKAYRDSAKDKMCCVCYSKHGVVLHHVRYGNLAGIGRKPDDNMGIFLCSNCHHNCHQKESKFYRKYKYIFGEDVREYANKLYQEYKKGE